MINLLVLTPDFRSAEVRLQICGQHLLLWALKPTDLPQAYDILADWRSPKQTCTPIQATVEAYGIGHLPG